eukprot:Opistho-2@15481
MSNGRAKTLRVFEKVPRDTIRKMRHRCDKKFKELQQEDNNSASDSDSDGDESGERAHGSGRRRSSVPKLEMKERKMVFTRSWKYIATIAVKISAFLVLGVIFFSLSYYEGFVTIENDLREGVIRVNYATYIRTTARSLLWSTYDTSAGLTQASVLANIYNNAKYELNEISRGLEIGSSVYGIPPQASLSGVHNALLYDDACNVLNVVDTNPSLMNECERIGTGILKDGLSQAVIWYLTRITDMYGAPSVNFTGADTVKFLNRKDVVELERFEDEFLQQAFSQSVDEYIRNISDALTKRGNSVLALLIVFIILSVLLYVVVYHRLIRSLDIEMKRTRSMMLMLPNEELGQMTWIDAYVTKLAGRRHV